jgi:hypothetical protein
MSEKEITLVLLNDEGSEAWPVQARVATLPPVGLSGLETLVHINIQLSAASTERPQTVELLSEVRRRIEHPGGNVSFERIPASEFDEMPPGCVEIDGFVHRRRVRRLVDFLVMTTDEHVERSKPFAKKCQCIVDHND